MQGENKRGMAILSLMTGILFLASSFLLFLSMSSKEEEKPVLNSSASAAISPLLLDGETNRPLENAVVVIPETGKSYKTDASGRAADIKVPVVPDSRFDAVYKKTWGEITIIAYKEGYKPYLLLYTNVFSGEKREGPTLYMYREDSSAEPFAIIESPSRFWMQSLIEKYNPY